MKKPKISKGAAAVKIKWDEKKHERDIGGRFKHKPGSEEFKAEPFGAGKTSGVVSTDVIKLHVKANPKKMGSAAANDFAKYQDNMTVGQFKAAVGPNAQGHLAHDTKKGFITIHDPKTLPPVEKELSFSDYVITSKTAGVVPSDKIKLLSTSNPKKPGSKSAGDFAKYKDEMTVGEFHAAVGDKSAAQGHILHDLKKGYISVHNPAELKLLKTGAKSPGQAAAEMKIGDKKLGVPTANPFTPGTKNHTDFEDTAKKLGLQTPAAQGAASKAATEATAAPTAKAVKIDDLADDDIVITSLGNKYSGATMKQSLPQTKKDFEAEIAKGNWKVQKAGTVAAKPVVEPAAPTLKDDDVIETYMGNKYTVAQYKAKFGGASNADAYIASQLKNGDIKLVLKSTATTTTPIAGTGAAIPKIADIQKQGLGSQYDIQLTTTTNPYPNASPEWIKYQAISMQPSKSMSVSKYYTTKALTPEEKTVTLQKMVDDGYVKIVTPEQKAAVAAQKAKIAATAATQAQAAQQSQHKLHFEQVKPADYHNDPVWSKVPGFKDVSNGDWGVKRPTMYATKDALGLKFNNNQVQGVSFYTGSGYGILNKTLREQGYSALDSTQKTRVTQLDKLTTGSFTKAPAIMWRGIGKHGMDPQNFNNMPPPPDFTDMGYTSMSHNPEVATRFAGRSVTTNARTIFRVRVPAGTEAAFISRKDNEPAAMRDEAEIIAARGTRYRYISTTRNVNVEGSKYDVIELEIVAHDGSNV